jgi:predicted small lipoprotein YifL
MRALSHTCRSAIAILATLVAACGQKGPLTLPDHGATAVTPPAPTSPNSTTPSSAAPNAPPSSSDGDPSTQAKKGDKDEQSAQPPSKP